MAGVFSFRRPPPPPAPWLRRDSSFSIATAYGLEDRGSIPSTDKDYFLLLSRPDNSRA
jgi:hypothetical protein